jgi:hypothetical protein
VQLLAVKRVPLEAEKKFELFFNIDPFLFSAQMEGHTEFFAWKMVVY